MTTKDEVLVFIFRRDMRLYDNTTFIEAIKKANIAKLRVLPIFICNPVQLDTSKNEYASGNAIQFMTQCLQDLNSQLGEHRGRLLMFQGADIKVLEALSKSYDVKCVAYNKDITPFALKRDETIVGWCETNSIEVLSLEDYTLYPVERIKTNDGKPYVVYTPFYRKSISVAVPEPKGIPDLQTEFITNHTDGEVNISHLAQYYTFNAFVEKQGGRKHALTILDSIHKGQFKKYKNEHDFPYKNATTKIGAYLKFGCVSIRESFKISKNALGKASHLVAQLYFREFYYNIAYHHPEILNGQVGGTNTPLFGRYESSKWNTDVDTIEKWKQGQTGYPIVDAGMRCLNKTGWLHNRLRMIVAMFLVRDLGVDWRVGEKYFAQKLVDYDPANNNQGWYWVLSYNRKFNPYRQTGKYDDQCEFIKKWVPELTEVPVADIITWWDKRVEYPNIQYPAPMIELPGYRVKGGSTKVSAQASAARAVKKQEPVAKQTPDNELSHGLHKLAGTGRGFTSCVNAIRGRGRGRGMS
jgi:deoxyribodipyrimidine photo-lyase